MDQTVDASAIEFAGFWRRLTTSIVDSIVIGAIAYALSLSKAPFILPVIAIISMSYLPFFWTLRGQTPGMMLMGTKVIRTNGTNISFGYAILRYIGRIVSGAVLGLGFVWIAFDARKQGWHDKIADTYVVKLPSPQREVFPAAKPSTV